MDQTIMRSCKTILTLESRVNWLLLLSIVIFSLAPIMIIQAVVATLDCGEYGFRCIDETKYEICENLKFHEGSDDAISGSRSEIESEDSETGQCPDDTVCDEEYPFYCSPTKIEEPVEDDSWENGSLTQPPPKKGYESFLEDLPNLESETKLYKNIRQTTAAYGCTTLISSTPLSSGILNNATSSLRDKLETSQLSTMKTAASYNITRMNRLSIFNTSTNLILPFTDKHYDILNVTTPSSYSSNKICNFSAPNVSLAFNPPTLMSHYSLSTLGGYTAVRRTRENSSPFTYLLAEVTRGHALKPSTQFSCNAPGNFVDPNSKFRYYFCDIDSTGEGYIAIPKTCPKGRIFDITLRECVLPQIADAIEHNHLRNHRLTEANFTCFKEGKFAVPHQPKSYYKCELNEDDTYLVRIIDCENGTIFDKDIKECVSLPQKHHRSIKKTSQKATSMNSTSSLKGSHDNHVQSTSTSSSTSSTLAPGEIEIMITPPPTPKPEPRPYLCHSAGRHADPNNCTIFYVCHPKRSLCGHEFDQVRMICPSGQIFNQYKEQCVVGSDRTCKT